MKFSSFVYIENVIFYNSEKLAYQLFRKSFELEEEKFELVRDMSVRIFLGEHLRLIFSHKIY
jgi:hypothetical protein